MGFGVEGVWGLGFEGVLRFGSSFWVCCFGPRFRGEKTRLHVVLSVGTWAL